MFPSPQRVHTNRLQPQCARPQSQIATPPAPLGELGDPTHTQPLVTSLPHDGRTPLVPPDHSTRHHGRHCVVVHPIVGRAWPHWCWTLLVGPAGPFQHRPPHPSDLNRPRDDHHRHQCRRPLPRRADSRVGASICATAPVRQPAFVLSSRPPCTYRPPEAQAPPRGCSPQRGRRGADGARRRPCGCLTDPAVPQRSGGLPVRCACATCAGRIYSGHRPTNTARHRSHGRGAWP